MTDQASISVCPEEARVQLFYGVIGCSSTYTKKPTTYPQWQAATPLQQGTFRSLVFAVCTHPFYDRFHSLPPLPLYPPEILG